VSEVRYDQYAYALARRTRLVVGYGATSFVSAQSAVMDGLDTTHQVGSLVGV
jgi:hypothetical protein